MFKTIKRLWNIRRLRPEVQIKRWARATSNPRVNVAVCSLRGMQTVYDYADNDSGNASAEMHGRNMASITGLPLRDMR